MMWSPFRRDERLLKPKFLPRAAAAVATSLVTTARNATATIAMIRAAVLHHFYDDDVGSVIRWVEPRLASVDGLALVSVDVLNGAPFKCAPAVLGERTSTPFEALESAFFEYFYDRLPIVLKLNRPVHRGRPRRPNTEEIDHLSQICFDSGAKAFPHLMRRPELWFPGGYWRMNQLTRPWVRQRDRENAIYDIEWLWAVLRETYPDVLSETNAGAFTGHVIRECFPMFWNQFVANYRMMTFWWGNFGWFDGDTGREII